MSEKKAKSFYLKKKNVFLVEESLFIALLIAAATD